MTTNTPQTQRGFTLLELIVTLAVAAIIISLAVPSFSNMLARHRLSAAASTLKLDLQEARSQAIKLNKNVYVSFKTTSNNWHYGVNVGSSCDPKQDKNGSNPCKIDGALKTASADAWQGVKMTLAHDDDKTSIVFNPRRGMATQHGTIRLKSSVGHIDVTVSPIGHVTMTKLQDNSN